MMSRLFPLALLACGPAGSDPTTPADGPAPCEAVVGDICPYAGIGSAGYNGESLHRQESMLYFPMDIVFSEYGRPVFSDWNNHRLRLIEDDDTITTIMGTDFLGDGDPLRLDATVVGAPGTEVNLNHPTQQRYLSDGRLLSASWHTHKLRTWDPETGLVHVYAGSSPDFYGDNMGDLSEAKFNQPVSVELDRDENIYVVDMRNERVRFIDTTQRKITTIAGSGDQGFCGDGGPGRDACMSFPRSENPEPGGALAFSADESELYIADTENHVIRVLDMETRSIHTFAGGPQTPGNVDGDRLDARFDHPRDLAMSPEGILYVADSNNHAIRAIDTRTGEVTTVVGNGSPTCPIPGSQLTPQVCSEQATAGDGGPATEATLYRPFGVAFDLDGNLMVADTFNHRIRVVYR